MIRRRVRKSDFILVFVVGYVVAHVQISEIVRLSLQMRPPLCWSLCYTRATQRRCLATIASTRPARIPQTVIEKVVQKYAVGLPEGKAVKAGDYVMIRPEHVMTHDNTGPVITKYACFSLF